MTAGPAGPAVLLLAVISVGGFEPLAVRLSEGLSLAGSERDFAAISPLACIKVYQG